MCFNISAAAWTLPLPGVRKLVLLALCDRADKAGKCWPSVDWIGKRCGLSERAVRSHIGALASMGLLRRVERMGRSTTYYITLSNLPGYGDDCADGKLCPSVSPEESNYQDDAPAPQAPALRHLAHPAPAPQAPISNHDPIIETINIATAIPVVDVQVMQDFKALRKAKRRPALTHTELDALRSEGEKIGMGLSDVLKTCVIRGWTRFEAVWLPTPPPTAGHAPMRPLEPVQAPACAETVSEGVGRLASLRNAIKSAVCVTGSNSLAWAHTAIAKKQAGDYVAQTVVRQACTALKMDYRVAFN